MVVVTMVSCLPRVPGQVQQQICLLERLPWFCRSIQGLTKSCSRLKVTTVHRHTQASAPKSSQVIKPLQTPRGGGLEEGAESEKSDRKRPHLPSLCDPYLPTSQGGQGEEGRQMGWNQHLSVGE